MKLCEMIALGKLVTNLMENLTKKDKKEISDNIIKNNVLLKKLNKVNENLPKY